MPPVADSTLASSLSARLALFRRLARSLHRAVAEFTTGAPAEIMAHVGELEGICDDISGLPADQAPHPPPEAASEVAGLLAELRAVTLEVQRLNRVYVALVRESRRTVAALLHHLGAYSAGYDVQAAQWVAVAPVTGTELRVSS